MKINEVEMLLSDRGYEDINIVRVTEGRNPVFKASTSSGQYYLKSIPDEAGDIYQRMFKEELDIGAPSGDIVTDELESSLLISDPADGWRLSTFSLLGLHPGAWYFFSASLSDGVAAIGSDLGTLHSETQDGNIPVGDNKARFSRYLQIGSNVQSELNTRTVKHLKKEMEKVRRLNLPFVRIHGDPTPHNLYIDPKTGNEAIIDFSFVPSISLDDLVAFECGIELTIGRLPYGRRSQQNKLLDEFRDSYLQTSPHNDLPRLVDSLKLAYYSTMLERYLDKDALPGRRARITRYTDRRVIKRKIKKHLSDYEL